MRLGPLSEKEFIIVLKSPNNRQAYNMASFLNIKMANNRRNANLEDNKKQQEHVEKHLLKRSTSQSDVVIEEKVTITKSELKVMLLGKLENPKIECLRELYHKESDCKLIPLGVKKS